MSRDITPALGTRGQPGRWRRAVEGAAVALHRRAWGDGRESYIFKSSDTEYGAAPPDDWQVAAAARRMRGGEELPADVEGPILHPAVWTWEVPLYFWFGGIASGSSFVALASELAGDRDTAVTARRVTLAAVVPCAPLLVLDLGRPERFGLPAQADSPIQENAPQATAAGLAAAGVAIGATIASFVFAHRASR